MGGQLHAWEQVREDSLEEGDVVRHEFGDVGVPARPDEGEGGADCQENTPMNRMELSMK